MGSAADPGYGAGRTRLRTRVRPGTTLGQRDAQHQPWVKYPGRQIRTSAPFRPRDLRPTPHRRRLRRLRRSPGWTARAGGGHETITRAVGALDQRSGSAGRTDDAGAKQGGADPREADRRDAARGGDQRAVARSPNAYTRGSGGGSGRLLIGYRRRQESRRRSAIASPRYRSIRAARAASRASNSA